MVLMHLRSPRFATSVRSGRGHCIRRCHIWQARPSGPPVTKRRAALDDVLARRTRALFLDARASIEAAATVAALLAAELGRDPLPGKASKRPSSRSSAKYLP